MGIKLMFFANGNTGLAAICNVCGKQVKDADTANIIWFPPSCGDKVGDTFEPFITCKDECENKLELWANKQGKGFEHLYSQELNVGLIWLLQNSGLMPLGGKKMKEAKRLADFCASVV